MEENLKILGLSEPEIKIYLACLRLGSAKASEIAAKAHIERQAAYYTLKLLFKKGMITETIKSGVQYYAATHPSSLLARITEEQETKEQAIQGLLTEFEHYRKAALPHPSVEQYEGLEGFKTILREIYNIPNETLYSLTTEKIATFLPILSTQLRRKRIENNVFLKVITEETSALNKLARKTKKLEIRFHPILMNKDYALAILQNKTYFLHATEREQIGIKIEDQSFAELQKNLFEELWKHAK